MGRITSGMSNIFFLLPLQIQKKKKKKKRKNDGDCLLMKYRRFESYDQPWQKQFNKGDRNWEDHWGLMGIDRKLKDGVKIPDCGGKTVAPTN